MNKALPIILDYLKNKADTNGDGKVDKQDLELLSNAFRADVVSGAHYIDARVEQFATAELKAHTPGKVMVSAALVGAMLGILIGWKAAPLLTRLFG